MAPLAQENIKFNKKEEQILHKLDKGIEDMEQGNTIPHEEAMRQIREKVLKRYEV